MSQDTSFVAPAAKKATRSRAQGAAVRARIQEFLDSDEFRQIVFAEMVALAKEKLPGQVRRIAASGGANNPLETACMIALRDEVQKLIEKETAAR